MKKETFLIPGVYTERGRKPGEKTKSIEQIVSKTMNLCGYPCSACGLDDCATADLCATISSAGCVGGGVVTSESPLSGSGTLVSPITLGPGGSVGNTLVWNGSAWLPQAIVANNGLSNVSGAIKLGGTLLQTTNITAPANFDLFITKDNVSFQLDGTGGSPFGTGESARIVGSSGSIIAESGIYTNFGGAPQIASYAANSTTNKYQQFFISPLLESAFIRSGQTIPQDVLTYVKYDSSSLETGYTNNTTVQSLIMYIQEVTVPAPNIVMRITGLLTFANDAAAIAALPANTLWRDPSNFLKITP